MTVRFLPYLCQRRYSLELGEEFFCRPLGYTGILNVKTYVPLKVISACQLLPYLLGVFVKMKEL